MRCTISGQVKALALLKHCTGHNFFHLMTYLPRNRRCWAVDCGTPTAVTDLVILEVCPNCSSGQTLCYLISCQKRSVEYEVLDLLMLVPLLPIHWPPPLSKTSHLFSPTCPLLCTASSVPLSAEGRSTPLAVEALPAGASSDSCGERSGYRSN